MQRGDSSLRLNVHYHTLALDGVCVRDDAGLLHFHALPTPTLEQVADVTRWTYEGLARVCELDADADRRARPAGTRRVLRRVHQ